MLTRDLFAVADLIVLNIIISYVEVNVIFLNLLN